MATVVIMPRQGQSVESCIITTWQKKKGDRDGDEGQGGDDLQGGGDDNNFGGYE